MYQSMKLLKIGTLNVQGCRKAEKRKEICRDAAKYNIQILGITETHFKTEEEENEEETIEDITIKDNENKTRNYKIYHSGTTNTYAGVGLVIDVTGDIKPRYEKISERIIKAGVQLDDEHYLNVVVAYAPTLVKSEKQPKDREDFYDALQETIRPHIKDKHMLMVIGDFNAKTGTGYKQYKEEMGRHGKGEKNNNGDFLLQLAKENKLILTNTMFPHKMAHRTTWTSKERINTHNHHDGTTRRNPYRNQIDYIMTKQIHKNLIMDSRSYGGFQTETDHKLVIADVKLEWKLMKRHKTITKKLNLPQLYKNEIKEQYKTTVKEQFEQQNITNDETPQETWTRMTKTLLKSAESTIGFTDKKHNHITSEEIKDLSKKQKKLKQDIESTTIKEKRIQLKRNRNQILNQIKSIIKDETNKQLEEEIKEIEKHKDDSTRCHQAVRTIKAKKAKKPLMIRDKNGKLIGAEADQVKLITEYFSEIFSSDEVIPVIEPAEMDPPFNKEEIQNAAKRLKNNKSCGKDGVSAELLKYAPEETHEQIAEMLNTIARTGEYPEEIKAGILTPLAKPPKKDAKINVRPIVLLSVLRKILTISLIERTWNRLKDSIPKSQAAYQKGRSTTEQVFTFKAMIEKAITSNSYNIFFILLDMSKAFDSVSRPKLLEYLKEILTPGELHMMYILIHNVTLNVRLGKTLGKDILTNLGITQGDCLSALLFIFYLAKTIKDLPKHTIQEDHRHQPLWSALDWVIDKDIHNININPKYADDISFIRSEESKIHQVERLIPEMLKKNNLEINKSKTEKYHINNENKNDESWKKCKYLGSRLDTVTDIKQRKILLNTNYSTLQKCFESKHVTQEIKIRLFTTHLESIFLYNSELWTLTKSNEEQIDSYHRRQLRKVIGIRWPKKISNKDLYERTKVTPWSIKILKRKISWFGHLLRLDENTPARKALKEFCKETRTPRGRPKTTWLQTVINDIKELSEINVTNLNLKETIYILKRIADDRKEWTKLVYSMMLSKTTNVQ